MFIEHLLGIYEKLSENRWIKTPTITLGSIISYICKQTKKRGDSGRKKIMVECSGSVFMTHKYRFDCENKRVSSNLGKD